VNRGPIQEALAEADALWRAGRRWRALRRARALGRNLNQKTDPDARRGAAWALLAESRILGQLRRYRLSLRASERMLARFSRDSDPLIRAYVAGATVQRGVALYKLGRHDQSAAALASGVATYEVDTDSAEVQRDVLRARYYLHRALGDSGRLSEAVSAIDEYAEAVGEPDDAAAKRRLDHSLWLRRRYLMRLGRPAVEPLIEERE
jgi:tetratricopeptide (TPR) repeat protein